MCRLFAIRSVEPSPVHGPLVVDVNALRHQSREHPHGWGIAYYADGAPQLARGVLPAHEDEDFARWSREVASSTVLAHVRKASIGAVTLENTHPFRYGPWVMAHNGTVSDFTSDRGSIEALIAPSLRELLVGETDSERIFALVLTALSRRGDLLATDVSVEAVLLSMEDAVRDVMTACAHHVKQPSLNLVITNGRVLAAFRHGRSLFYSTRGSEDGAVQSFSVSSERIGAEADWIDVPEDEFVAIDAAMHVYQRGLTSPLPKNVARELA